MDTRFNDGLAEAAIEDIERGYTFDKAEGRYCCLLCGSASEQGVIYPSEDGTAWWDAEKWIQKHIVREHGSVFHALLHLDKKWTGLSALQRQLLQFFHQGMSDAEVVERIGGGSASTIRNHRFTLREKEKQAKLFLVLMSLMEKGRASASSLGASSKEKKKWKSAAMPSLQDAAEAENDYFPYGMDGPLREWPRKEKQRMLIAEELVYRFQPGVRYPESEVNEMLEQAWPDYALLRRYMVDRGLLQRTDDGREYWVGAAVSGLERKSGEAQEEGKRPMSKERRKELVQAYQEKEQLVGVFKFTNTLNGKALVGTSKNLEAMGRRLPFNLKMGSELNKELQKDWNEAGEEHFQFEILELLKIRKDSFQDVNYELQALESKWLNELQPFGERGYNSPSRRGRAVKTETEA